MSPSTHDVSPLGAALVVLIAAAALAGCGEDKPAQDGNRPPQPPSPAPGASATATPVPAAVKPGPPRTRDDVLAAVGGRRIRVAGRTIRIDPGTVVCGGVDDTSERVRGRPAWTRFRCIQPTFPQGSVAGPDVLFVVASVAPRRLVIGDARLSSY